MVWVMNSFYDITDPAQLQLLVEDDPQTALADALPYMSAEQIVAAAKAVPASALMYAPEALPEEVLTSLALQHPQPALMHAAGFLSPAVIATLYAQDPDLTYLLASSVLTSAQIADYVQRNPVAALKYNEGRLSASQLETCRASAGVNSRKIKLLSFISKKSSGSEKSI